MGKKNVFAGTGISSNNDPFKAGKEASEMAIKDMQKQGYKKGPDLGFVFCSGGKYGIHGKEKMQLLVDGANEAFSSTNPNCQWIGCTTASEISSAGYSKESCVAMAISSEFIKLGVGIGLNVNKNPDKATKEAFKQATSNLKIDKNVDAYMQFLTMKRKSTEELIKYSPFHLISIIQGPLKKAGREDEVVACLRKLAGPTVPITGGSSADDFNFKASYQFYNGKAYTDALILLSLISHVKISTGTESGFKPTSKTFVVTKCNGRIIYELNNKPAAKVLAEAYGSTVKELAKWENNGFQKCFFLNEKSPILIVEGPNIYRVAVFHMINPKDNSIVLGSGVADYTAISIGKGTKKDIIDAAPKALKSAMNNVGGELAAVICFDCDLRLMALKNDIIKEQKEIKNIIGNTPVIGFFTNGEQCFLGDSSSAHVNYTITCIAISNKLMTEK